MNSIFIDESLSSYIDSIALRESEALTALRHVTAKRSDAIMQISPRQGQFMAQLLRLMSAKRVLEIGTYTGYSTLCFAQALRKNHCSIELNPAPIITLDINSDTLSIAREHWRQAGIIELIDARIDPALSSLEFLLTSGEAETFDFIFIDADKRNYSHYYEQSLKLIRKGGLIAIDNTLLFGSVIDPNKLPDSLRPHLSEEDIAEIIKFNRNLHKDLRVSICTLEISDGLTLVIKN